MKKLSLLLLLSVFILFHCAKTDTPRIKAQGIVEGDVIAVKAQVTGIITKLRLQEGTKIKKGEFMAQIDNLKVKNKLQGLLISGRETAINKLVLIKKTRLVQGQINYLKKRVNRFKRLKKKQSIAGDDLEKMELKLLEADTSFFNLQKSLDNLEIQKEKIKNKIEYLKLVLKDHTILSPVGGIVLEKFVSTGQLLAPGISLADIMDLKSMYIDIFIEEREISLLKINQEVILLLDGDSGQETGIISGFGRKAEFSPKYIISEKERKSLLYKVKIKIKSNPDKFKLGMPVTVLIKTTDDTI